LVLDRGGRPPKQNIGIMQNHLKVVSGERYLDLGSYRCRWRFALTKFLGFECIDAFGGQVPKC